MRETRMNDGTLCIAASLALAAAAAWGAAEADDFFRPDVSYADGAESFPNPARGCAVGGWTTFKPEGLPKWKGAKAYNSSLWELSRFSGGREQGGTRPNPERVGGVDRPLSDAMKADVRRYLEETRQNGGSLIVRLGYTWSEQAGCEPSDFDVVLGHVRDLSAIMADYEDVVVGVEAGVAGPWGEMHSSDYCGAEYMNRILETYCDNLPEDISVLVRSPGFIAKMAGTDATGALAMLPFAEPHLKRIGMYNDGYLGTWSDYGTWIGGFDRERGVEMLRTFGDHPYGGELAYVSLEWVEADTDRARQLFELEHWNIVKEWYDTHLSYLRNAGDRNHSLCKFIERQTFESGKYAFDGMPYLREYDGKDLLTFCQDHMGYRFIVRDARLPRVMRRGKDAVAELVVENTGFGRLLLRSRVEALFVAEGKTVAVPANTPWGGFSSLPGGVAGRMPVVFTVPDTLPSGTCDFLLRVSAPLKDEVEGVTPRRSVRLANEGMWDDGLKANAFGKVTVR